MNGKPRGNYAKVNGLEMYYETHGTGQPLILLHGAFRRSAPRSETFCRNSPRPGG